MYILIGTNGVLSLRDEDNFREFSIVDESNGLASTALAEISEPAGDDHFWLDANAVIELSPRDSDQQWIDSFWEMLGKVEAYGYSNLTEQRVKAHLVIK